MARWPDFQAIVLGLVAAPLVVFLISARARPGFSREYRRLMGAYYGALSLIYAEIITVHIVGGHQSWVWPLQFAGCFVIPLGAVLALWLIVSAVRFPTPDVSFQFCDCGYDLTGNVSGICPECGQRRPGNRGIHK
ncbi:MAG TPA: hypothetical protein VGM03_18090 [Phycisphaerae bacterium]|jgi:hypothetical protein